MQWFTGLFYCRRWAEAPESPLSVSPLRTSPLRTSPLSTRTSPLSTPRPTIRIPLGDSKSFVRRIDLPIATRTRSTKRD